MKRPNSVSVSTDEAREVYEAQRDEICNLTLPPARELRDFHKELWIKFGKEETATVRRIAAVQERLKQQQEALFDLGNHQHYGSPAQPTKIDKIKYLTKEIQNALKKVNAWNRGQLHGLERSQNAIEEELEVIEKALAKAKIEEPLEEKQKDEDKKGNAKSDATEADDNDEERIYENIHEDFHTWISKTGGHNGGWHPEDHLHMVTLTHRHANWRRMPERFLEDIWSGVRGVPSREAVRKHVEWYMEYCVRRDKQKERIGQWKKSRAQMKEEERKHSATSMKLHKTTKSNWLHKNKEKLRKLEEWKKLKTVKKEIEEAEELLRVAEKKAKIEQRMERRNVQIKRYLKVREEKKKMQMVKEEEERRVNEMERRHRRDLNRMVLSQYHEKDMERIQWKIKQKADDQARKEEQKKLQMERLTRPVQARRELDNVFRSTVSSSSRDRETREKINLCFPAETRQKQNFRHFSRRRSLDFGDLYHLHNLPKLATPEWRTLV